MPTSVPVSKTGIREYLATSPGLTDADDVVVRSAPVAPDELAATQITLGDVTAPQTPAGLARREEKPVMICWIEVTRPGSDEAAMRAARNQAGALLGYVEAALHADPSCAGTVPAPAQTAVGSSDLTEFPIDIDGSAGRRAQYRFTVTWTSHIA